MKNKYDIVFIDGIEFVIDFRARQFTCLVHPESFISFESEKGKILCGQFGIEKCQDCHRYVQKQDLDCPFCEHLLMCD